MNTIQFQESRRVLVIDDNPSIHSDFRKILLGSELDSRPLKWAAADFLGDIEPPSKKSTFEIHSAFQGQEGLAALEQALGSARPFEMAFVDVRMPPGWDGIETIPHLWKADPDLQVVICTAYSDYDLDEIMGKLGLSDKFLILKKPFDSIEVLQLANACTEKRRLIEQAREHSRKLREDEESLRQAHATLEERVRERTEELRKLSQAVEQSPVAVVITNRAAVIEYVNPQFTRVTGYSSQEAIGQNPRILKSDATPPARYRELWDTLKRGEVWHGEFCNRRKDGELYWENAHIAPLLSHEGKITHYIAVKADITELKRVQLALQDMNEQLETATARSNEMAVRAELASLAKSQFLSNMSHELRTPINGVIGMTELLLGTELDPEQRQFATVACNSGQALLSVINDILDFSKIEAGKMQLEAIDFDLRATLEDAAEILAAKAAQKGLQLVCLIDPAVPLRLRGDPGRLRQILLNLAGNAVKFTARGEVVMRAVLEAQDQRSATIRVAVTDTGKGIPSDRQHLLFSSFVQLDGSATRKQGGTGLGLAISKQLAGLMGGGIGVESVEGQGSTFWFTARMEKRPTGTPGAEAENGEVAGVNVLVVEPHALTRLALTQALCSLGCRSAEAPDPPTALRLLRGAATEGNPFRFALVDARLLDSEGLLLVRQIKNDPAIARTSLVLLTDLGQCGEVGELTAAGFDDCLAKPIRVARLRECLVMRQRNGVRPGRRAAPSLFCASSQPERPGARILVADDNPTNQLVALKFLERLGHHADAVSSGPEALAAMRNTAYDLVLMDCEMPDLDGLEVARRIRSGEAGAQNRTVPIIAVTACTLQGDRQACLAAGMNEYLAKPFHQNDFASAVSRCLRNTPCPPRVRVPADFSPQPVPPATKPPPPADAPAFDRQGFLQRLMGDLPMADAIVQSFLADVPNQIRALKTAASDGDSVLAGKLGHRIKGACSTVGGTALQRLAHSIEQAGRSSDLETLHHLIPQVDGEFERLRQPLESKVWRDT